MHSTPSAGRRLRAARTPESPFSLLEMLATVAVLATVLAALMFVLHILSHGRQSSANPAIRFGNDAGDARLAVNGGGDSRLSWRELD